MINGCKNISYWERLRKLKILSLQRRRERYTIIHTWKILHGEAPNDVNIVFSHNQRLGIRATVPAINHRTQASVATDYESSFKVRATKLWNTLPKKVNSAESIGSLKIALGKHLEQYPDNPPTQGYSAPNGNSILDWSVARRPHIMQTS